MPAGTAVVSPAHADGEGPDVAEPGGQGTNVPDAAEGTRSKNLPRVVPAPEPRSGPMSYVHCPKCRCAYNIAQSAQCPRCPVLATEVDPTEDIVVAAEQLARAMARATDAERKAAAARMGQLALPAPGAEPDPVCDEMLRSIRQAMEPVVAPPPPVPQRPLLAAIAYAVVERITERVRKETPQLMERLPSRLRRAGSLVRARMRALAA